MSKDGVAEEVATRFGTPCYIYDAADMRRGIEELGRWLPEQAGLVYSIKANPSVQVARVFSEGGLMVEVSSLGELGRAIAAGFDPRKIVYTGPARSAQDIARALEAGVLQYSVESWSQLQLLDRVSATAGVVARAMVRVNVPSHGRGGLRMTGQSSQFGIDVSSVLENAFLIDSLKSTTVVGLHLFSLSNAHSEEALIASICGAIETSAEVEKAWRRELRVLNLGGGFASPYCQPGERPRYPGLRKAVNACLDQHFPDRESRGLAVWFESGRFLVGTAGSLVLTILDVKDSGGKRFVICDGGVNVISGLSATGRMMRVALQPVASDSGQMDEVETALVGPLCTPADILTRDARLGHLKVGDRLLIPNVGAYGATASLLAFLSHAGPREICVDGDRVTSAEELFVGARPLQLLPISE